jgi:hypothetical protein
MRATLPSFVTAGTPIEWVVIYWIAGVFAGLDGGSRSGPHHRRG